MLKEQIKQYLIIFFIVVEILSMIFNFYTVKINVGPFEYNFNFSVVFFCLGFFVVDIISDRFSKAEAKKFIYYKFFSQSLFLIFGNIAIKVYGLEETQLAILLQKSPWMILAGLASTYVGYNLMSSIMSYMKIGVYQGSSVFKRYIYSTIPGELVFSLIFTVLCFYRYTSFDETMHLFMHSAIVKIILSTFFASIMSIIIRVVFYKKEIDKHVIEIQVG